MRTFLAAAVALVALAGPTMKQAQAQGQTEQSKTPMQLIDEQKRNEQADVDRRYRATVRQSEGTRKVQADPWRTIRPAEAAKKKLSR